MSASRLFELVFLLLERRKMTAVELAEHFEVSPRTIYRDLDALSAAGIPVYTTQGKGGGVALLDQFVMDRAAFTEEEQRQLLTALQSLPPGQGEQALSKLTALFRRREPDWLQVNLTRWGSSGADNARFELLRRSILGRRTVAFVYASARGATAPRRVLPARLVFQGQAWYRQGFCLEREAYRTFRLSRMLSLRDTGEPFHRLLDPPPIEPEQELPPLFSVEASLRFAPRMAYRVYDEFDEACVREEPDGALTVQAALPEDAWLYGYLLSFGTAVEVLAPASLRRRLAALAEEIAHVHGKPDAGCQVCRGKMEASEQKEAKSMKLDPNAFCQSCGMPLSGENKGTEADGTPSPHYCKHCYQSGAFTGRMTMEEMIDFCAPMMAEHNPPLTPEQAKEQMRRFFPLLLRWSGQA